MKKLGILIVLSMMMISSYAYSDAASAFATSNGWDDEAQGIPAGYYAYMTYTLHVYGLGTGSYSYAYVSMDYGVIHSLTGNNTYNKTKTGAMHNGGSVVIMYAEAKVPRETDGYAFAMAGVRW